MALHNEIEFENDICQHLATHGWLYVPPGSPGDASDYDTPRALYPADLLAWVQASQPQAWEALTQNHGAGAEAMLLDQLRKQLGHRADRRAGCGVRQSDRTEENVPSVDVSEENSLRLKIFLSVGGFLPAWISHAS